jgi:hypothetical protein
VLCALLKIAVTKNLEVYEAKADYTTPKDKHASEKVQPKVRAAASCACGHGCYLRKMWRPVSRLAQNIELSFRAQQQNPLADIAAKSRNLLF